MRKPWLALFLLAAVTGCGKSEGRVTGRVLIEGKPLPGGLLTFRPEDPTENSLTVILDKTGEFAVTLPTGKVFVSVDNSELQPRMSLGTIIPDQLSPELREKMTGGKIRPPTMLPGSDRYVPIPSKYAAGDTSGLDFVVASGAQKRDIELKK